MDDHGAALRLVTDDQRRRLLRALTDERSLDRSTLLDRMQAEDESRAELRIELHHTHLPKLDAADVVAWDSDGTTVERGENFGAVAGLLDSLDRSALPGSAGS